MKQRQHFIAGFALVVLTLAVYWPSTRFDFIVMDDDQYVYENQWVTKGLSWAGVKWAFTAVYAANWHPLTWISHLLDSSLYGTFAGGHHLTSIALHSLNALLLLILLRGLTNRFWPSLLVSALFAWHPLHVESVAWISERKDVLSTFFFLLTLIAYSRYARSRRLDQGAAADPVLPVTASGPYLTALLFFALGLMSKPMLVTVPCVLLLLDFWPLQRFQLTNLRNQPRKFAALLVEKVPFFALALAASVITIVAQHAGGAIKSAEEVPLGLRLANALAAYARYIAHTFYPAGLCAFYPLHTPPPVGLALVSALGIAVITLVVFRVQSRFPWALVGWFWFVGTLIPVIGIVQVGSQSMADRYTYIPLIGLFVAMVWSADYLLSVQPRLFYEARAFGVLLVLVCLGLTRHQLAFWHDSVSLYSEAVRVTDENAVAENNLGVALVQSGRRAEAVQHYREAVRINPKYTQAHYNLGIQLADIGELDDAAFHFSEALKGNPKNEVLHNNLGVVLARQKKLELASSHFQQAISINPRYPKPYLNYGKVLQALGEAGLAATNYARALQLDPDWPDALDKMAWLLATCPDPQWRKPEEAIHLAKRANGLTQSQVPAFLETLAVAFASTGQFSNATLVASQARDVATKANLPALASQLNQQLEDFRANRNAPVDWRTAR